MRGGDGGAQEADIKRAWRRHGRTSTERGRTDFSIPAGEITSGRSSAKLITQRASVGSVPFLSDSATMKQRVAVIGAGAAGLSAARQLIARPQDFECVVFEQADQVGGTWVYTDNTGSDEFGLPVHSSMYKSLR
jgi:NADPH-dependent 2,4-dienoyl-CoA reductase/sulfur reductase-like enzyme